MLCRKKLLRVERSCCFRFNRLLQLVGRISRSDLGHLPIGRNGRGGSRLGKEVVEQARKQEQEGQEEQGQSKSSFLQYQAADTKEISQSAASYQQHERHGRPQDHAKFDPSSSDLVDQHNGIKQSYYNSQMSSTYTAAAAVQASGTWESAPASANQQCYRYHPQPQEQNFQGNGHYDNYNGAEASAPPQHHSFQEQQQQRRRRPIYDAYGEEIKPFEV